MEKEIVKDKFKELPNEIILLSYYQAYCETCRGEQRRTLWLDSFALGRLPHNIPDFFEYLVDVNKQFKVYETLKSLDNEKKADKEKAFNNSNFTTNFKIELLEKIDKEYAYEGSRVQTLWNFIVSFNNRLKENSHMAPMSLFKEERPITRFYTHSRKGCLIATQDFVFAIQEEPWGPNEKLIYTKNDKAFYDQLFKDNTKTTNK